MSDERTYPDNWLIGQDYDPNAHMMNLKGRDYLNVQNRLLWFIRDQRALIARGLARMSYIIRAEPVEVDREKGFAHFSCYIRDVLGNETVAYGSETAKDFGDYIEKAATKAEGRALLNLGYGTGFAPEMDEGEERPVDSPVERKQTTTSRAVMQPPTENVTYNGKQQQQQDKQDKQDSHDPEEPATKDQIERMRKYRNALNITDAAIATTDMRLRYGEAESRIAHYIAQWQKQNQRGQREEVAR